VETDDGTARRQVLDACRVAGGAAAGLFERLAAPLDAAAVDADCGRLRAALRALHELQVSLLAELKGRHEENVGRQLEDELEAMERAIVEATERMAQLWRQSRQSHSGVKLEVSDKILDSCSALMNAIIKLIAKAKTLQEEIVARGKGLGIWNDFIPCYPVLRVPTHDVYLFSLFYWYPISLEIIATSKPLFINFPWLLSTLLRFMLFVLDEFYGFHRVFGEVFIVFSSCVAPGSATATEFYKRNHQWTEGLLSAAKAVGFGAKLLT